MNAGPSSFVCELHDRLLCRGWRLSPDGIWYHEESGARCEDAYEAYYRDNHQNQTERKPE